jgi:glycosyltransferase involved in cell wall biosynthesis
MSRRLVHIIPTLDQSGAEKQLALLATELRRRGHDVTTVALTRGGHYEKPLRESGVRVEIIGKSFKIDPFALARLVKSLKSIKPELVQTWLFAANAYGRVAARRAGVAKIVASERCVDSWKSGIEHWVDRKLAPGTDRVVVNSRAVAEFYARRGIDPQKLVVIANAVPAAASVIDAERAELERRLAVPPDASVIGFVGRLWRQKRVVDLLIAFDVLRLAEMNVYLAIAGEGPEAASLRERARDLKIEDHVRFLGHVAAPAALYERIDLLALPSDFEGMPNVALEAMQAGKPVVASRIAGMDETVLDGETGVLVAPRMPFELAQAMRRLLLDPELRRRMGEAGRERVTRENSVGRMTDAYEALYESLLGAPTKSANAPAGRA